MMIELLKTIRMFENVERIRNQPFWVLLALTVTEAILHPKFEKVLKTIQNVPKTVDNHKEQLVLGLGYQF